MSNAFLPIGEQRGVEVQSTKIGVKKTIDCSYCTAVRISTAATATRRNQRFALEARVDSSVTSPVGYEATNLREDLGHVRRENVRRLVVDWCLLEREDCESRPVPCCQTWERRRRFDDE